MSFDNLKSIKVNSPYVVEYVMEHHIYSYHNKSKRDARKKEILFYRKKKTT